MKKLPLLIALSTLFIASCSNNNPTENTTTEQPAQAATEPTANVQQPASVDTPAPIPAGNVTQQVVNPAQVTTTPAASQLQQAPATAEGMNPAHGQPGHRCDIPVGAPLNSPPGNPPQAAPAAAPMPTQR